MTDNTTSPTDASSNEGDKPKKRGLLHRPVLLSVAAVVFVIVVIAGILWWLHERQFESTDDAFVDTHIVRLAPQAAGRVTQVLANDNALVQAGAPLILIDSADVQTHVAQAQAQTAQAQAQVESARGQIQVDQRTYQQALAEVTLAQAAATKAAQDLARYRSLQRLNPAAVAQQQIDDATTAVTQATAQLESAHRAAQTRAEQIAIARTQLTSSLEQVRAAQAQQQAEGINLGYTRIIAPVAGHVADRSVAVGDYVQPGTQLLAIVPLTLWVTANFKETQLALMRPGQTVSIKVDACPADQISGHVDSIQRGAGQAFAILPPQNATGNFVKVVQRVPVKIDFDRVPQDCPLGPGMSVEPTVRVR
ncbi:MAG TPA: HlyD family secretion protein [Steroidobacteraceae bacterium]|nr:HlyD family secretion protein [Steroidobacteraceae bacterium]